jgi:hypothetical protein
MFDFEKLVVYKKAKIFNSGIRNFIKSTRLDSTTRDQGFYNQAEEHSNILFAMVKNLQIIADGFW